MESNKSVAATPVPAELIRYNPEFVPNAFGLVNNGAVCYLNSLIQCSMSCPSFNRYMTKRSKSETTNPVIDTYVSIYENHLASKTTKIFEDDVTEILDERYVSG